jgi:high-affinity iron transporter
MRYVMWLAVLAVLAAGTPTPTPDLIDTGRKAYAQACAACHGATGEGNGPVAFAINPKPRNFRKDPFKAGDSVEQIFATITNGLKDTKMVGYPQIPETDRWGLAYVVLAFRPAK